MERRTRFFPILFASIYPWSLDFHVESSLFLSLHSSTDSINTKGGSRFSWHIDRGALWFHFLSTPFRGTSPIFVRLTSPSRYSSSAFSLHYDDPIWFNGNLELNPVISHTNGDMDEEISAITHPVTSFSCVDSMSMVVVADTMDGIILKRADTNQNSFLVRSHVATTGWKRSIIWYSTLNRRLTSDCDRLSNWSAISRTLPYWINR